MKEQKGHPERPFWEMTLSYGEHMARATTGMVRDESLKKLKGRE
jgi:hypothetical protein